MAKTDHDARLIYSASETDANMLWATRFFAPDPFVFIEKRGKRYVVVSDLEIDRARRQASVHRVLSYSQFFRRLQKQGMSLPTPADIIRLVLDDLDVKAVTVPATFPVAIADDLRKRRIRVWAERGPFWKEREIKNREEVACIREALRVAEVGMQAGIEAVRRSRIHRNGSLTLEGTPLTSEILKRIVNTAIMAEGCVPSHTIIASGEQCIDPHDEGSGPIRAHTSIIFDIFPRSQASGFFGDISRTIVRGRASERLRAAYATVQEGQNIGFREIRNGADGYAIHERISQYFAKLGFPTGKIGGRMQGFFHGTGHGLGLEIHELPFVGSRWKDKLRTGHVVTVEPGLYYSGMGGVRLEDVVEVQEAGCVNLVTFPKVLEV